MHIYQNQDIIQAQNSLPIEFSCLNQKLNSFCFCLQYGSINPLLIFILSYEFDNQSFRLDLIRTLGQEMPQVLRLLQITFLGFFFFFQKKGEVFHMYLYSFIKISICTIFYQINLLCIQIIIIII
eukprot:TRINITY_DN6954_c0_g1_i2.p3 TRINITY_DN6954_c0_g1~~TRINITY_DN6954_c0_g1_i2.p3  ORF type:complete len:125 (-),score=7.75 TRINITY_DN6954_c0_g1_i2:274-648(-)